MATETKKISKNSNESNLRFLAPRGVKSWGESYFLHTKSIGKDYSARVVSFRWLYYIFYYYIYLFAYTKIYFLYILIENNCSLLL